MRHGGRLPPGAAHRQASAAGAMAVASASAVRLQGLAHCRALLSTAVARRQTATTRLSGASFREHLVVSLGVVGGPCSAPDDAALITRLWLVDLMRAESIVCCGATGLRAREARLNNAYLLCLTRVLAALRMDGNRP